MLERWGRRIDEHPGWALGALAAFYAAIVTAQALLKLVWADELITYYIAQQPGLRGIWAALQAGADPNPPLTHVLVQASVSTFGGSALAMRLPGMLCVLLAIVAMWWMLRRSVRPVFALAGCLAFMATRGFDYAYDARSYALLMGFAMASIALWILAGDVAGWRRAAALAGMAIALAAGISSNYYGVLAFFPIAAGELAARRWRPGVWVAMLAGSLPVLAYLPLIQHNIAEFGPHAWNRPQASMIAMTYLELVEGIFWPVLALAVWLLWKRKRNPESTPHRAVESRKGSASAVPPTSPTDPGFSPGASLPELAALATLLLYPIIGFTIAVGGAGIISPRCVVPICCGVGLAAGLLAEKAWGRVPRAGMVVVLVLVVWVGVRESVCANVLLEQRQAFFRLRDRAGTAGPGIILVGDSSFVLPLYFYSPDEVRRRIFFPIDFEAIHRYERDDSGEQNIWAGRDGVFPFRVAHPASGAKLQRGDVLIARPDGWLARAVGGDGLSLALGGEQEVYWSADWYRVGGVFTPMAHQETRIMIASKPER